MQTSVLKGPNSDNQYINLRFHDNGGMSEIWVGSDTFNANREVVIKIIRIIDSSYDILLEEEFKIAKEFSHPNIVQTLYYDKFFDNTGDYFYSVMEFMPIGNLRKLISNASEHLPIDKCISYFQNLLDALKYAHKTIIHRDLKPENILIDQNGVLKICDFGIARYIDMTTRTKTFKGLGTFPYMSPECWIGDHNTIQMDIYSLGIIFFELLTQKRPFNGPFESDYRTQHLFKVLPSVKDYRNDIPINIAEIIRKMTEKNPNDRYKSIEDILDALNSSIAKDSKVIDVGIILDKIHRKANSDTEKALKAKEADQLYQERQDILNYSISQLFDKMANISEAVNNAKMAERINYKSSLSKTNAAAGTFDLRLLGNNLHISFFHQDAIRDYIKQRKQQWIDLQIREYGIVMRSPTMEHIERDHAILLGSLVTNISDNLKYLGFNLLLKKETENDIYGRWWICKFTNSQYWQNRDSSFCFSFTPNEFFEKYEFGRGKAMSKYHMSFKELADDDIIQVLHQMIK